jgi:hypothetical protein
MVEGSVVCCNSRRDCASFSRIVLFVSTLIRSTPVFNNTVMPQIVRFQSLDFGVYFPRALF